MTGSLFFVALERRQATVAICRIVLRLSRVLAVGLLCTGNDFSRAVFMDQSVSVMATGSGQADVDKPGQDIPILRRNPRVGVILGSAELYNLDRECVPDVLGLHARSPDASVVKVMLGRETQCVRVLIPDDNVGHRGFHDVL